MLRIVPLLLSATVLLGAAGAPILNNASFECRSGYHSQPGIDGMVPDGWSATVLQGRPRINSVRLQFAGGCTDGGWVERLHELDALAFLAQDIETPPLPGKPFDAAVHQKVEVTEGQAYSLSGFMVSFCAGSNSVNNDCPRGYYIAKMAGLDPAGGADPLAGSVTWMENRGNFLETRWVNLNAAARAEGSAMTVFARVLSPYRWHGNHAIVDAFSLVRAPTAAIAGLPALVEGSEVTVRWAGELGPDIPAIPSGKFGLRYQVQARRLPDGAWQPWVDGFETSAVFALPGGAATGGESARYAFRVRPMAEQPHGPGGSWPDHHFPGLWSDEAAVSFVSGPLAPPRSYLPALLE